MLKPFTRLSPSPYDASQEGVRSVTLLGATGSIGKSSMRVLMEHPERFAVHTLTAMDNVELLAKQAISARARCAVIGNTAHYGALREALSGTGIEALAGEEALVEAALHPADTVIAAIVGAAGLKPTFAAIARGARVLLANKESLVTAGALMLAACEAHGAELIPLDSEHSGVFQLLGGQSARGVERMVLTASGGPFRTWSAEQMQTATAADAIRHPTWSMGAKISVDSATLMNKGLELIEAHYLFSMPASKLGLIVHPQSIVHALLSYADGSTLAQLSAPDMRIPIACALAWPERLRVDTPRLDFDTLSHLQFEPWDAARFPAPALALQALSTGGAALVALNAANEVAVQAFLQGRIAFLDIAKTVARVLETGENGDVMSIDAVMEADARARALAQECITA